MEGAALVLVQRHLVLQLPEHVLCCAFVTCTCTYVITPGAEGEMRHSQAGGGETKKKAYVLLGRERGPPEERAARLGDARLEEVDLFGGWF